MGVDVFLINPPFDEECAVGASRSIRHVLNVIPPLGLAYCAAALENAGFRVEIFDCSVETRDLRERLAKTSPFLVGLTATTPVFPAAAALARDIRRLLPGSFCVIGGAHASAMAGEALGGGEFDAAVIGEGEVTLTELVSHLRQRGREGLECVSGIAFRQGERIVVNAARPPVALLDSLPYPARRLLPPLSKYRPTPASYRRLPLGVLITSRGCPHRCTFCDRTVFGTRFRARSAANVLGEVDELVNVLGARELRFFDDCFTFDQTRARAICAGLRKLRRQIPWTCLTSVDSVTPGLLREMRASGCWQVLFGLESGDERMLGLLRKGTTLGQNRQAVRWAREAGLGVRADFIVGTPGETRDSLRRTLEFALAEPLDYAHFNKFVPYPGTELYARLSGQGYRLDFRRGASITANAEFVYVPESVGGESAYGEFINEAHRRFYLRPAYILKRLLAIRTWEEFTGQARGFLAIRGLSRGAAGQTGNPA